MKFRIRCVLGLLSAAAALAQDYSSAKAISGTIRVLGNSHMETILSYWEDGFRKYHPDVRFENKYLGTANAIAGLYLETADLALMGREIIPMEAIAFRRAFRHDAVGIAVATASFDVPLETFAFAIFVHKDNPVARLTFGQLQRIFGCDHPARNWGDLGVGGALANRPIHRYGYEVNSGLGTFFSTEALHGTHKWNCDLREYANKYDASGKLLANAGDLMVADLSRDPAGIAFCGFGHRTQEVRSLPLARNEGGPFVALTREHVVDRTYPLTRTVYIYLRHDQDRKAPANVTEFFRYILSREGQQQVSRQKVYLPLPEAFAREEFKKLN